MFGLNSSVPKTQCAAIIDIGSGSVGATIIVSNIHNPKPEMIWSHREYVLIKDIDSTEVPLKEITTSLVNIFLQIGNDGLKKLHDVDSHLEITTVQVTVSAPWTCTVTKTINVSDAHPFLVNTELIEELSKAAEKQAFTAVKENKILQKSQLAIIDNETIGIRINGYPISDPKDIKTREVSLSHITALTQHKLVTVLEESKSKIIPKAALETHSFMYMFYDVLKEMKSDTSEACLIDITSEATEIGIIREGILTHVTNIAFGTFSLSREIAAVCKIPKEEAYTYLKGGTAFLETKLSSQKLEEVQTILEAYEDKIADLFRTTGDALAIPKTIFLHCEASTEKFFLKKIGNASKKATTMRHSIHPITSLFLGESTKGDTALMLSAHFFHQKHIRKLNAEN